MAKKVTLVLAICFVVIAVSILSFYIGFHKGRAGENSCITEYVPFFDKQSEYRYDLPLLDISFNDGGNRTVVIEYGTYSTEKTYYMCRDHEILHECNDYMWIETYPAGRGTTGNGAVYVYCDGKVERRIEFMNLGFYDDTLKDAFERITAEEYADISK